MMLRISLTLLIIAITYLSLTPTTSISVGNDKIGHFLAYSILMINIGLITLNHRKAFITGAIFAVFYGGLMEGGQYFVPGREVSGLDMIANVSGVCIGVVISLTLGKWMLKMLKSARIIK